MTELLTGLAAVLANEQQAIAAGAAACGHTCVCHGGFTCERVNDPGNPGGNPPIPAGHPYNGSPHVGRQPDDSLIQWNVGECIPSTP